MYNYASTTSVNNNHRLIRTWDKRSAVRLRLVRTSSIGTVSRLFDIISSLLQKQLYHSKTLSRDFYSCRYAFSALETIFHLMGYTCVLILILITVIAFLPCCMQCWSSLAMRILSVRPSVKRMHCDKTEERSVQIFIPYEISFSLVFWQEWLVGGDPFYLKFLVNWPPLEWNCQFWTDICS